MDFLGQNLEQLRSQCGGICSLKTVLKIADQVLHRIEDLHSRGVIHRDIKPENFAVGCGSNSEKLHIIDLGLANEYCDRGTGLHIPLCKDVEFVGNIPYVSARAHQGIEQSRRDDLEAIGYMLVGLLRGELPWERCSSGEDDFAEEWFKLSAKQKFLKPLSYICNGCPKEFEEYMKYCKNLKFAEEPDYQYLRGLFKDVFRREGFVDDERFDWSD